MLVTTGSWISGCRAIPASRTKSPRCEHSGMRKPAILCATFEDLRCISSAVEKRAHGSRGIHSKNPLMHGSIARVQNRFANAQRLRMASTSDVDCGQRDDYLRPVGKSTLEPRYDLRATASSPVATPRLHWQRETQTVVISSPLQNSWFGNLHS
jgi:hypothetical protein